LKTRASRLNTAANVSTIEGATNGKTPAEFQRFSDWVKCFCYSGDDPFVWPDTTTTTPPPGPEPFPPHVYTTTTGPHPANVCNIQPSCQSALYPTCGPPLNKLAAGCSHANPGDVAPMAGFFSADDASVNDVLVFEGQIANMTGIFCPEPLASQFNNSATPRLAAQTSPPAKRALRLAASATSTVPQVALALKTRASRLNTAADVSTIEGATNGKTPAEKCYKCLEKKMGDLRMYGCPTSDFGYRTMEFCYCGIDW